MSEPFTATQPRKKELDTLNNLIRQAPVGMCVFRGESFVIEVVNERQLEIWGKSYEEVIGKPAFEALPEAIDQGIEPMFRSVFQTGEPFIANGVPAELVRYGKRELSYYNFTLQPLREDDGAISGIVSVSTEVTKQVLYQKQIEESEQKLRLFVEHAPAAVAMLDTDMRYIAVSNRWMQDFGFRQSIIGKSHYAVFPEIPERWKEVHKRALAGAVEKSEEDHFDRADGTTAWLKWEVRPWHKAGGKIGGIVVFSEDITERKKADEALRESERRFRTLAEALPQMVWMRNNNGVMEFASQNWERYSGVKDTSEAWQAMTHPDDWNTVMNVWKNALATNRPFRHEVRLNNKEGEYRWHFATGEPVKDERGNVTKWIGALTDVHDQKMFAESLEREVTARTKELRQSQSFLQQVIDSSVEYICVLDKHLRFITINRSYEQAMKQSRETLSGRYIFDFVPNAENTVQHESIQKALNGETVHLGKRSSLVREDVFIDTYFIPYRAEGKVEGVIIMARDVTAIIQTEKKLEQAVKELHRSNEDLQQFAHVASHDLKEPVRKVMTFSNRLRNELGSTATANASSYLSKIESSAMRMYAMIDGVLLYSSLDALHQAKELIDVNELMENITADLEVPIQEKGARIRYSSTLPIHGSSVLMHQLFYNLVNNSLKFARADRAPLIELSAQPAGEDELKEAKLYAKGPYVKLILRDNGIGFDEKDAERIFGTFTRLHSKDQYDGTGLGLALCRKIVERHGGKISAAGKLGDGAAFSLLLPTVEQ